MCFVKCGTRACAIVYIDTTKTSNCESDSSTAVRKGQSLIHFNTLVMSTTFDHIEVLKEHHINDEEKPPHYCTCGDKFEEITYDVAEHVWPRPFVVSTSASPSDTCIAHLL